MSEAMTFSPSASSKRSMDFVEGNEADKKIRIESENDSSKTNRLKLDKYAMLTSYSGNGYFGMQINGDTPTIEKELLTALFKCDLIDDEDVRKPGGKLMFQRAARTDKNVSAVKQMCSLKLPRQSHDQLNLTLLEKLNATLPKNIRIWTFIKSTHGFNSKNSCDNRTYSYTVPSFAFAPSHNITEESYRITNQISKVNYLLALFKGTKNFYNFTFGRQSKDRSLFRFIMAFTCGDPFIIGNYEFVTVRVRGQSFMIHQIRKMIGLTIAVIRGLAESTIITKALDNNNNVDVPKAPGLGLVLEEVHYDWYNKKFENTHSKLDWTSFDDKVDEFRAEHILKTIFETEANERSMAEWLKSLDQHSYTTTEERLLSDKKNIEEKGIDVGNLQAAPEVQVINLARVVI